MSVVDEVRSDEHPLRQRLLLQVVVEQGQILDLGSTLVAFGDGVEADEQVVLSHVGSFNGIVVFEAFPASIWKSFVLLRSHSSASKPDYENFYIRADTYIISPADTLVLKEVDDS